MMSKELGAALFLSLAAHASVVTICPLPHTHSAGEAGETQEIVVLGVVQLSAPTVPPVPSDPRPVPEPEDPIHEKPARPVPKVEPLRDPVDEMALVTAPSKDLPVPPEEPTEAPVPAPQEPTAKALAQTPTQREEIPAEVPMRGQDHDAGQQQLTAGQIEDLRSRYLRTVLARLEESKRYPRLAYRRNIEGTTTVTFMILSNGNAGEADVCKSSRHDALDNAAKDMVARAAPFDPLPIELGLQELRIVVPVAFQIDGVYQR